MNISFLPVFLFLSPPKFPGAGSSCVSHNRSGRKVLTSRYMPAVPVIMATIPVIMATILGYAGVGCAIKNVLALTCLLA